MDLYIQLNINGGLVNSALSEMLGVSVFLFLLVQPFLSVLTRG